MTETLPDTVPTTSDDLAHVTAEQEREQAASDYASTFLAQLLEALDPKARLLTRGQNAHAAVETLLAVADECDPADFLRELVAEAALQDLPRTAALIAPVATAESAGRSEAVLASLTKVVKDLRDDLAGEWKDSPTYLSDCHRLRQEAAR